MWNGVTLNVIATNIQKPGNAVGLADENALGTDQRLDDIGHLFMGRFARKFNWIVAELGHRCRRSVGPNGIDQIRGRHNRLACFLGRFF